MLHFKGVFVSKKVAMQPDPHREHHIFSAHSDLPTTSPTVLCTGNTGKYYLCMHISTNFQEIFTCLTVLIINLYILQMV